MQTDSAIHKARELSPELRRAAQVLLGRELQEDENISVRAFKGEILKSAPTGQARDAAYQGLRSLADQTAERVRGVPESEIDAAIDEAADYVRHHRE